MRATATATTTATSTPRSIVVLGGASLVVACALLSGCFALFSLDGYGPPDDTTRSDGGPDTDATVGASVDGSTADARQPGRTIFVTAETFNGNLGTRDGGDTTCQAIATDAGISGTYRVWLSDPSGDAADVLASDAGPLRLRNGAVVAANVDELAQNGPLVPVTVDERGRPVGGGDCGDGGLVAWTGTSADGGKSNKGDCGRWSSSASFAQGAAGLVGQAGPAWTGTCLRACDTTAALYCIQQ
jgi:hypothetical protein